MDDRLAKNLRTGMLVASVAIVVLAVGIILLAMLAPGNWIEVRESEPIAIGMEGTSIRVTGTVEVDSNMPYTLEDLDVSLVMVDRERGSRTTLYSESGIHVPSGRSTISIDSGISASTVMLMVRDRAVKDGAALEMELDVDCRYMLGLAGFHLTSDIMVPITAEGSRLEWSVTENTDDSFTVNVTRLADWLIPDDRRISIFGGGESFDMAVVSDDGEVSVSFHSDQGLDGVLKRIASSSDAICVDGHGILDWSSEDIRDLDSIVSLARRLLRWKGSIAGGRGDTLSSRRRRSSSCTSCS